MAKERVHSAPWWRDVFGVQDAMEDLHAEIDKLRAVLLVAEETVGGASDLDDLADAITAYYGSTDWSATEDDDHDGED